MPPRFVEVDAERLPRWVDGFVERHRGATGTATASGLDLLGGDHGTASIALPFLPWPGAELGTCGAAELAAAAVEHVCEPRTVLVLLLRRGGYAVAVLRVGAGGDQVVASKVGGAHVQGRTAAGGWSQQRFARRRDNQTTELVGRAVQAALLVLLPALGGRPPAGEVLLVTGGDAALVGRALADPRLAALRALPATAPLAVPDPRAAVLAQVGTQLRRLRIALVDADG